MNLLPAVFRSRFYATVAGVTVLGLLLGAVVAIVSSPGSFAAGGSGSGSDANSVAAPSPSPSLSPTPAPLRAGTLAAGATLVASGATLFAIDSSGARESADGGVTWTASKVPQGSAGLIVDGSDPKHRLVGGATVQVSSDGGATWAAPKVAPPGAAPFTPVMLNPADPAVWFVAGNSHLMRTRDAGISWKVLTGLPTVTNPRMAAMTTANSFLLAIGGLAFELIDNGTEVKALPGLPSGGAVELAALAPADPPSALAVTDTGHAYLMKSGAWSEVAGGLAGPIDGLPDGRAWVGDGGTKLGAAARLDVTLDGGATWKPATGLPADQSVEALAAAPPGGASVWAYCAGGDIYHSTDGGLTWSLASKAFRSA
jgi:photosystem II stability/assembly factor-like uncharacterized protein